MDWHGATIPEKAKIKIPNSLTSIYCTEFFAFTSLPPLNIKSSSKMTQLKLSTVPKVRTNYISVPVCFGRIFSTFFSGMLGQIVCIAFRSSWSFLNIFPFNLISRLVLINANRVEWNVTVWSPHTGMFIRIRRCGRRKNSHNLMLYALLLFRKE